MSTTGHAARQTRRIVGDVSLDEDQELRARRVRIADQIREVGITAAGSVLQAYNVCGTATCRCHTDPARRHGPYWQHTRKVGGKTVTRRLTAAQAALYLQWIGNDRRLRGLLQRLKVWGLCLLDHARRACVLCVAGRSTPEL